MIKENQGVKLDNNIAMIDKRYLLSVTIAMSHQTWAVEGSFVIIHREQ
jgi:hypothetical protein